MTTTDNRLGLDRPGTTADAREQFAQQMRDAGVPFDACGRPQLGANRPGFLKGRIPANKGRRYEPEPLTTEELNRLLNAIGEVPEKGDNATRVQSRARLRAAAVVLIRTGLRISEMLALTENDLNAEDRTILVRSGKGGKRRIVKTDRWAWAEIEAWLAIRRTLPVGALFCVLRGPTIGRPMADSYVRVGLKRAQDRAGIRKRCNPHTFRHSHAADLWREGIDVLAIQRQLGHVRLDVTQLYLRGLSAEEVLAPIGERPPPTISIGHGPETPA